ncbi:MAG: HDOD domain-containing protein [Burkholderiales bacterium]|nr:HDOD domain-containing protein [Burkholderiales bacterium]
MKALLSQEQMLAHVDDLPSLPAVVMDLLNSIDQEDADIGVIAKKVSLDQALTAKTLRLANSACFTKQVKVTTIQHAITFLGIGTVRNLITAAALTGCFPQGQLKGFDYKGFWRHSIATATCAKVLARYVRFNQDYAFTAGLLHDIGRLVLVTQFPEYYEKVIAWRAAYDSQWQLAERTVLGVDHIDAGKALAAHWHFSGTLQLAIAGHHQPDAPGAGFLATLVHVADCITHGLDLTQVEDDIVPPVSIIAWNAVGIEDDVYLQIFRETEMQTADVSRVLLA